MSSSWKSSPRRARPRGRATRNGGSSPWSSIVPIPSTSRDRPGDCLATGLMRLRMSGMEGAIDRLPGEVCSSGPPMDQEREEQRRTYVLCRLGFAILSIALALACMSWALSMAGFLLFPLVGWLRRSAFLYWVDTPIVWGSLVGTYLLWGRWSH